MWDDERIVPNIEKNAQKCLCPECPVYNECMKKHNEYFSVLEVKQPENATNGDVNVLNAQSKANIN